MYIQKVFCDISCTFAENTTNTSVAPDSVFNLTKDFSYIVPDNVVRVIPSNSSLFKVEQIED